MPERGGEHSEGTAVDRQTTIMQKRYLGITKGFDGCSAGTVVEDGQFPKHLPNTNSPTQLTPLGHLHFSL